MPRLPSNSVQFAALILGSFFRTQPRNQPGMLYVVQIPGENWSITYFSNLAGNAMPFRQIVECLRRAGLPDLEFVFHLQELTR